MGIECFAPTATDILLILGCDFGLYHNNDMWVCQNISNGGCFDDDNPAEAVAKAWLAIHEKPGTEADSK